MRRIVEKIAFIVHVPNMYSHYSNIWELMNQNDFVIILTGSFLDKNKTKLPGIKNFIKKIQEKNYNYIFLDDFFKKRIKFKYVISNHRISGTGKNNATLLYWIKYIINNIKLLIKEKGIQKRNIIRGLDPVKYLPLQVGNKQIRFMYGADISDSWSLDKWNEIYDLFLCHGPNDETQIRNRYSGETRIMGYPRYDSYFSDNLDIEGIYNEFNLEKNKKTILWMPTVDLFNEDICSIPHFSELLINIQDKYNFIVRPHPMSFSEDPEYIKLLQSLNYSIDTNPMRDMNKLYRVSDIILCDYGGSAFSALYLQKRIIFLETPGINNSPMIKNSSNLELMSYYPVINKKNVSELDNIISDDEYWKLCLQNTNVIFHKYFGDYRGTSSKRTVEILYSLDEILQD